MAADFFGQLKGVYTRDVTNYDVAEAALTKLKEPDREKHRYLEVCKTHPDAGGLDVRAFLIMVTRLAQGPKRGPRPKRRPLLRLAADRRAELCSRSYAPSAPCAPRASSWALWAVARVAATAGAARAALPYAPRGLTRTH